MNSNNDLSSSANVCALEPLQSSGGSSIPNESADLDVDLFDTVERSLRESARRAGEAEGREAAWREGALQGAAAGAALARHAGDVLGTVDVALELLDTHSDCHCTSVSHSHCERIDYSLLFFVVSLICFTIDM